MWRALADPEAVVHWPSAPQSGPNAEHEQSAWWVPATHLLRYSFGWTSPAAGLRWWYDAGKPKHDVRLALLDAMLGPRIDELAAWYWYQDGAEGDVDPAWMANVLAHRGEGSPYAGTGGYDPLHMGGATEIPRWADSDETDPSLTFDAQRQLAVLVVDRYAGWAHKLHRAGQMLKMHAPDLTKWKVETYCRPIGSLGTYRYSSVTDQWFAGRHRHHVVGCPPER